MSAGQLFKSRLKLVPQTREDVREEVEQMLPHEKGQLSEDWLALLDGSSPADPGVHGFVLRNAATESLIGRCGFKGPPGPDGSVEIAYFIAPEERGKGFATE